MLGADLNRSWNVANEWCHPTIRAVIDMLVRIDKNKVRIFLCTIKTLSKLKIPTICKLINQKRHVTTLYGNDCGVGNDQLAYLYKIKKKSFYLVIGISVRFCSRYSCPFKS